MKEYLKMADVFVGEYKPKRRIDAWPPSRYGETLVELSGSPAQYAANAINSHDELVQINQDLLEALEDAATSLETIQLRSFGEDSFLDSKPEMRSYAGSRASVARAAIAKAKGGAA